MTSLKYYKHYLWTYTYMYIALFISAISLDCASPVEDSKARMIRFLVTLVPFVFSLFGILIQYHSSSFLFDFGLLQNSRKTWIKKSCRFSHRRNKKVVKRFNLTKFMIMNMVSNTIPTLPLIALALTFALGQGTTLETNKIITNETKIFFLVSFSVKHAAWYFVFFFSRYCVFWGKKRLKNLV